MKDLKAVDFYVFKDSAGNRAVFPAIYKQNPLVNWYYLRQFVLATNLTEEQELMRVEIKDNSIELPHVQSTLLCSYLSDGSTQVWLIGGPIYDEARKATLN